MLAAQLCGLGTCIGFLEHADDLLFRKSFLHCHSFGNGLYIDFVLITGSRSSRIMSAQADVQHQGQALALFNSYRR
ncbi:hypothetical protein D554_3476 [Bordetella holmesii 30539]|uniref:N-acetyltransferase YedL n=1 Tax=Bordetella holmesii 1058 TaxID=1247648 RepID=A0ABP3BG55_9BORD|nr:hypothetical protein D560_3581 [Bordetella holmesii ATCC 51541]AIT28195.1 hypothetical protein D558_3555 [Bordetella holmesii 44057]EWM40980.1 hypothetical protein D555_3625 [Bordetella holmesii 35009]EWM42403.1 hypothetical protein D556_3551 [Bordetella holmesii 41130]EWM44872.1 hypothetical protein D557_2861 [Bordetella holmesii 70147]EXF88199.1 hypothetical protein D554_3476 [Bordetella holmesii 30539]EXX94202.1 hypothetical protein D559_1611 [Bordetella holmesii 1058]KAK82763.1 hypoth